MATRAKKKKKGIDCHASINSLPIGHLLLNGLMDFKIILQEYSLSDPSTKIAKMVQLGWTKWPPELKIEKKNF